MDLTRMAYGANMMINQVLQVRKGETVLIVTDTDRPRSITQALAYSAISAGGVVTIVTMEPQEIGGEGVGVIGGGAVDLEHDDPQRQDGDPGLAR